MRTLQDHKKQPERRTALVARVLKEKRIDVAALSETRLPDSGQLKEICGGYTFFWIGRPETEKRESGVGFAIANKIVDKLESLPIGVNDRLMSLRISIGLNRYATLISAYAPTLNSADTAKEKFYFDLRSLLNKIPHHDKIILLGDFNARVGSNHLNWPNNLGRHGIGKINQNGILLLSLCSEFGLSVTNTLFQQPNRYKTTWRHPRSGHGHMIDYVIVRSCDKSDVTITRAFQMTECWSDHALVRSRIRMKIKPIIKHDRKQIPRRLDVSKLKADTTKKLLSNTMDEKLQAVTITENIEESWGRLRDVIYESSKEVLGFSQRKHQDWFDVNDAIIYKELQEMYSRHRDWMADKACNQKKIQYRSAKSSIQAKLRNMKQHWWEEKAKTLQESADKHDMKSFYQNLKGVFGPNKDGCSPVLSADGNLLTARQDILKRWGEHFKDVLNRESNVEMDMINNLPQRPMIDSLAQAPSLAEVKTSIKQLSNGKAPGEDGIPGDIFKCGGGVLAQKLTELLLTIWNSGTVPQQFKDATIVYIYKHKGNKCT